MAMVMVDAKPQLRSIGINNYTEVNIEELEWMINNSLTKDTEIYVMLQGQTSLLTEIVRLIPMSPYDKTHTMYKVVSDQKFRINNEQVLAKLLVIYKGKSGMYTTNTIAFTIKTDNYALERSVAIMQEIGLAVEVYYQEIARMYNEIKKGEVINDNESCCEG